VISSNQKRVLLMTSIYQLLSKTEVPPSPLNEPGTYKKWLEWMAERRDPRVQEPWVDTIRYDLNRRGYRCDEFEDPKGIKLFTVGDSFTFGTAVPYEATFSFQVAKMIEQELGVPVTNWNLAFAGKNADYVARIVSSAIPSLRPDLAIVNYSFIPRREFITDACRVIGYTPNVPEKIIRNVMFPEAYDIYKAFDRIVSAEDDVRNFTLNFRLCKETFDRFGAVWCFSTQQPKVSKEICESEGSQEYIGDFLKSDGRAADGSHPGPEAHLKFAKSIMAHLRTSGKLQALKRGYEEKA
jgi:hypothetical protein